MLAAQAVDMQTGEDGIERDADVEVPSTPLEAQRAQGSTTRLGTAMGRRALGDGRHDCLGTVGGPDKLDGSAGREVE